MTRASTTSTSRWRNFPNASQEQQADSEAEEEGKRHLEKEFDKKLMEMTKSERAELEKQARAELSGISQEFITDMSIRGKMWEILSREQ